MAVVQMHLLWCLCFMNSITVCTTPHSVMHLPFFLILWSTTRWTALLRASYSCLRVHFCVDILNQYSCTCADVPHQYMYKTYRSFEYRGKCSASQIFVHNCIYNRWCNGVQCHHSAFHHRDSVWCYSGPDCRGTAANANFAYFYYLHLKFEVQPFILRLVLPSTASALDSPSTSHYTWGQTQKQGFSRHAHSQLGRSS